MVTTLIVISVLTLAGISGASSNAQEPAPQIPAQTPPAPATGRTTDGITLPQGAPPTGLQAPLPTPITTPENPKRPAPVSPGLRDLNIPLNDRPITINDAVAIALATNRNLTLAQEALLRAQGRTSEQRAAFNPTLGTNFQYTRLAQGQSANIGGQNVTIVNPNQPSLGVSAALPLDIAGALRAAKNQAQFQEVAARLDINRSRNQLVSDVKSAFYQVLRNQALVAVSTEALNNAQARLDDAQKKFIAGVVARFDVTRAQTDVSNAQQQLITARSNVSDAIALLNNTMGIDINTELIISDAGAVQSPPGVAPPKTNKTTSASQPEAGTGIEQAAALTNRAEGGTPDANNAAVILAADNGEQKTSNPALRLRATALSGGQQGTFPQTPPPGGTEGGPFAGIPVRYDSLNLGPEYAAALEEALATRPDVLEAEANIAAAKQGVTLARRSQLPTLSLAVGGVYTPNAAGFSPQTTTGQFGLTIQAPIFDGGLTRARVSQARADVAQAETNRRQAIDTVTLDVRRAYLALQRARSNVAVANQGLEEAQESYRLARVRYDAGVASQAGISPLLEVSDAQSALTQAQSNQVNALYDYNNARAALDRAIGRYSYQSGGSGYAAPPAPRVLGLRTNRNGKVIDTAPNGTSFGLRSTAPGGAIPTGTSPNGTPANGTGNGSESNGASGSGTNNGGGTPANPTGKP